MRVYAAAKAELFSGVVGDGHSGAGVDGERAGLLINAGAAVAGVNAILAATKDPVGCLAVGTIGNWLGSVTTYWIGRCGKWEWIEKWFKVKKETLEKQKKNIDKYGVWLALLCWIPFIGDVFAIALGFYRTPATLTSILMLIGKFVRFLLWNLIYGLF